MDWTAPPLLAAFAAFAALELWFVVAMVVTGRHGRDAGRDTRRVSGLAAPPGSPAPSAEELGLLADGDQRWVEVALLRLCLDGVVREDGLLLLVDPTNGVDELPSKVDDPRAALLFRLRRGRPVHLLDVVWAGLKHADSSAVRRRLVERGLLDEPAARAGRTRIRVLRWYGGLLLMAIGALVAALVSASGADQQRAETVVAVSAVLVAAVVTAASARLTGGKPREATPAGADLIARAARELPDDPDELLLRQVALRGLRTVPRFAEAAERGAPDAGLTEREKAFGVFSEVFSTVAGLFSSGRR